MADRVVVLGAGLVGSAIAADMAGSGFQVVSADLDPKPLQDLNIKFGLETVCADFTNPKVLVSLLSDADLVIGAAPGSVGYALMKEVIRLGRNMVDISFCPENYLDLDTFAREKRVTVVADMGVAPGMCNVILGYTNTGMQVERYQCVVGGLPVRRTWPLQYKSSWSPIDCIEEYVRPARLKRGGRVITLPALSDLELTDFEEVGTLEAWNSDGLRSLLTTMPNIPDMVEKTLRYPGTTEFIRALRELGYFSYEEIEVRGEMIRPIDLTANLLFPQWKLNPGEEEFTIMRVTMEGKNIQGRNELVQYDLYDTYDPHTNTSSMARTTGYAATGVAVMMLKGMITGKGVLPPEQIGHKREHFEYLLNHLSERNVIYRKTDLQADA